MPKGELDSTSQQDFQGGTGLTWDLGGRGLVLSLDKPWTLVSPSQGSLCIHLRVRSSPLTVPSAP